MLVVMDSHLENEMASYTEKESGVFSSIVQQRT